MSDILNGKVKRLPKWEITIAMVRASVAYAETKGGLIPEGLRDERDWRRRYADVEHDLDAVVRSGPQVDDGVRAVLDRLDGRSVTATAAEFASDVRALLEGLLGQAERARLPSYLRGHADLFSLTREVRVRTGLRGASGENEAEPDGLAQALAPGENEAGPDAGAYALAADRDERENRPVPWSEVAAAHDRVVVLADPGLGKSWLIRTETRRLARAALGQAGDDPARLLAPVPLRCDQLAAADGADLPARAAWHLVSQGLLAGRSRGPMTELIRAGRAMVLLDALDELTSEEAGTVRGLISSWTGQAGPQARCVITSRIAGYTGPPLPDATEVELQPFTPDDVTQVIRAWRLPAAAERELLRRAGDPAVAAMTRVPLLLAMLCALAAEQPAGSELPRTRRQLYERVLRWFLTRAHRSADDPAAQPLTDVQVEALLELLAPVAFTFASRPGGWADLMPAQELLNAIRAAGPAFTERERPASEVLLDLSVSAGVLVPDRDPSDGRSPRYLFLHRTFAEYLVARHLATLPSADWLAVVARHQWFDPDWENVIPMLGGQLDRPGARQLIAHLLASGPDPFWHALLTAIAVAGERPDADAVLTTEQSARLARATRTLLRHDFGGHLIAGRIAGLTHLPRAVRSSLLTSLDDQDMRVSVREALVSALTGWDGQDVTNALIAQLDDHYTVWRAAARALAGRDGQDITAALLARLDDTRSYPDTRAVAEALAARKGQDVTAALLARLNDQTATGRKRPTCRMRAHR